MVPPLALEPSAGSPGALAVDGKTNAATAPASLMANGSVPPIAARFIAFRRCGWSWRSPRPAYDDESNGGLRGRRWATAAACPMVRPWRVVYQEGRSTPPPRLCSPSGLIGAPGARGSVPLSNGVGAGAGAGLATTLACETGVEPRTALATGACPIAPPIAAGQPRCDVLDRCLHGVGTADSGFIRSHTRAIPAGSAFPFRQRDLRPSPCPSGSTGIHPHPAQSGRFRQVRYAGFERYGSTCGGQARTRYHRPRLRPPTGAD